MGIDGIGKPPIPPSAGAAGPTGTSRPASTGESFRVGVSAAESSQGSEALGRLQRGEIDVSEYLEIRVSDAVSHLQGRLSAEQLSFVKESLRAELETDPVLVELVRRTTGGNLGV